MISYDIKGVRMFGKEFLGSKSLHIQTVKDGGVPGAHFLEKFISPDALQAGTEPEWMLNGSLPVTLHQDYQRVVEPFAILGNVQAELEGRSVRLSVTLDQGALQMGADIHALARTSGHLPTEQAEYAWTPGINGAVDVPDLYRWHEETSGGHNAVLGIVGVSTEDQTNYHIIGAIINDRFPYRDVNLAVGAIDSQSLNVEPIGEVIESPVSIPVFLGKPGI
jgi:hypothetical protein